MSPVPSKDFPAIFLAVSKAVAVAALPDVLAFIVAGKLIVIVCAVAVVSISLAVPAIVSVCVSKSTVVVVEPSPTVKLSSTDTAST